MTSNVLRTLEGKGWLTRKPHPVDTRAKLLSISPAGRLVFRAAVERVEQVTTQFFSQIPAALQSPFLEGLSRLTLDLPTSLADSPLLKSKNGK